MNLFNKYNNSISNNFHTLSLRNLFPSLFISILTLVLTPIIINGLNYFSFLSIITVSIIFFIFFKITNYMLRIIHNNRIIIKLNFIVIFSALFYYGLILSQQILTLISSNSLYYLTVNNVVPEGSSFISRIFSFFIPESIFITLFTFFLISYLQSKNNKFFLLAFKSQKEINLYQKSLFIALCMLIFTRLLSASLSGIISLLIINYIIFINFSNFSLRKYFRTILKNIYRLFIKLRLKLLLLFSFCLFSLFIIFIVYISNNRGGDYFYLIKLVPQYIKLTYYYTNDIFNYYLEGKPSYCGLQSNIILYFFNPKPVSICLEAFRNSLTNSGLFLDGAWIGLFGAHSIDYGSNFAILSIMVTLSIYYFVPRIILNISTLREIKPIISMLLLVYYPITVAFLFTGFISANYIMIIFSIISIIFLKSFSLIKVYKIPSNQK